MPQIPIMAILAGVSAAATIGGTIYQGVAQSKAASSASKAQAAAAAEQKKATDAQLRESRAAEEDAQLQASNGTAAARIARAAGKRVLAFQGVDTGVGGGNKQLADTLGG